jgi:hypothetical protein
MAKQANRCKVACTYCVCVFLLPALGVRLLTNSVGDNVQGSWEAKPLLVKEHKSSSLSIVV